MIGNLALEKLFSTTTAVLDVSENILEQLDKNNFVGAVCLFCKMRFTHKLLRCLALSLNGKSV